MGTASLVGPSTRSEVAYAMMPGSRVEPCARGASPKSLSDNSLQLRGVTRATRLPPMGCRRPVQERSSRAARHATNGCMVVDEQRPGHVRGGAANTAGFWGSSG